MRKFTFRLSALLLFLAVGSYVMAQSQFSATFNVDMSTATGFDPATENVFIAGTFADIWAMPGTNDAYKMTATEDNPSIYTVTVTADSGLVQYKYFRVPIGDSTWAGGEWDGDPNRMTILVLDNLSFDDTWGTKPMPVTFNVDVTPLDTLDPATDNIYISGDFAHWATPGMIPQLMLTPGDNNIYSTTLMIYPGDHEYKFFVNEAGVIGWSGGEWDGGDNRTFSVDSVPLTLSVVWGQLSGIFDHKADFTYKMYPNPVHNNLMIDGVSNVNRIDIYDVSGRMVKTFDIAAEKASLNVSDLNKGVYLISIHGEKGVQTGKFIKN